MNNTNQEFSTTPFEEWRTARFSYYSHRECEYFPCHDTDDPDNFNCLFCYCPLYALGWECNGNFYFTESGLKSCKNCIIPHKRENFGEIKARYGDIVAFMRNIYNCTK